jgi:hypothetical protein
MLEAERSFRRVKGCQDMPILVAAVRREVARRLEQDEGANQSNEEYDQAVA